MSRKLIPATELAEFVYCAKAWELKYVHGAEPSSVVHGEVRNPAHNRHTGGGESRFYRRSGRVALICLLSAAAQFREALMRQVLRRLDRVHRLLRAGRGCLLSNLNLIGDSAQAVPLGTELLSIVHNDSKSRPGAAQRHSSSPRHDLLQ